MQIKNSYNTYITIKEHIAVPNEKEAIILCHGFLSGMNQPPLKSLYTNLSKEYNVFIFNFIGRGSHIPPYTECISDLFDVITYVNNKKFTHITLVGHSMGAAISLMVANNIVRLHLIKQIVFIGMPSHIDNFEKRHPLLSFNEKDETYTISIKNKYYYLSKDFIDDTYRYSIPKELGKLSIPALIIQGEKDNIIKRTEPLEIYKALYQSSETMKHRKKQKVIKKIKAAGHLFITQKAQRALTSEIISFITAHKNA